MNNNALNAFTYLGSDGCPLSAWILEPNDRAATQPSLLLLHGGGPDHHSMVPLARRLAHRRRVILPDIRGYGRSICTDPDRHTWNQYVTDVAALLDTLGIEHAVLGGAGIGTTITLRAAIALRERIAAAVLISIEDIEDDAAKAAEIELLDRFADSVRTQGLAIAWEPILQHMAPLIGALVRDAIPRADPTSIAAAGAIGRDRSFRDASELAVIEIPTLVFPGADFRHPAALAKMIAELLPRGRLASESMNDELRDAEDFGRVFAPPIAAFLDEVFR